MRSRSTSDSMKNCFVVCLLLIYKHIIKKFGKGSQSDLRIALLCIDKHKIKKLEK
jgi:hypothetical protein